jgi:hypothetical protein
VGMPVTITGIGFTPSGTATVRYYLGVTEYTDLASVPINPSGSFTANFEIPPSAGGAHSLTVSDGPITKSFTFIMETAAPPTPAITLPLADTKLKDNTFEWDAVADGSQPSNPVTYDLQVASDDTFSEASLLLDKTGLAETSYTLLDAEKLESTNEEAPYYWHVRAVDAASNASGWSEATAFTVGWSFEFAGWVVYVTMAVIAIAFFFIGLAVGRRGGGGGYYY